jgi:predicted PurR-regulated permease PerM
MLAEFSDQRMSGPTKLTRREYIERLIITLLILGVALLLWHLRELLILVFAASLFAVVLNSIAEPLAAKIRLPQAAALLIAVFGVLGIVIGSSYLLGTEVTAQSQIIREKIPAGWASIQGVLDRWGIGEPVRNWMAEITSGGGMLSNIGGIAMTLGNGITHTVLVIVGGIYIASQPSLYRAGIIKLIPEKGRPLAASAIDEARKGLRMWLLGQLVAMTIVGVLTGLGLWLLGVPSALTLALLAALLEFVPLIGSVIAAVPAILLALAVDPQLALWTALLYLAVQQIEGNVIQPIVQQRAVDLPPALLIFSLVAGGLLFGVVGVLVAAPLTVALYVLVKRLYVREALSTPTPIPSQPEK